MAYANAFKYMLSGNLHQVDKKLDDWAKNAASNPNIEIKRNSIYSDNINFELIVDGKFVVCYKWYAFSVYSADYINTIRFNNFPKIDGHYRFNNTYEYRPSLLTSIKLYRKLRKFIKEQKEENAI